MISKAVSEREPLFLVGSLDKSMQKIYYIYTNNIIGALQYQTVKERSRGFS